MGILHDKKMKKLLVGVLITMSLAILFLGAIKVDSNEFYKSLNNELVNLEKEHEIVKHDISYENQGFMKKKYTVTVEHKSDRKDKYPSEFILSRRAFSTQKLDITFD